MARFDIHANRGGSGYLSDAIFAAIDYLHHGWQAVPTAGPWAAKPTL